MKDTITVLREARAYLTNPLHWTQFGYRRDEDGKPANDWSDVVSCCAIGALDMVERGVAITSGAYQALVDALPPGCGEVSRFNDRPETSHGDVLDLFDRAIASEEKRD